MERSLFTRLEMFILTNVHQIGHKQETIALTCFYALGEIFAANVRHNFSVFMCFMGARKAFNRVNCLKEILEIMCY